MRLQRYQILENLSSKKCSAWFVKQIEKYNCRQIPFVKNDDGIFEIEFIEERKTGLEVTVH